ncbi:hypothetical protein D3C81_2176690 [compost metagenome]
MTVTTVTVNPFYSQYSNEEEFNSKYFIIKRSVTQMQPRADRTIFTGKRGKAIIALPPWT